MTGRRGSVWWLWPVAPLFGLTATTLVAAGLIDEDVFLRAWRTPKELDGPTVVVMLAVVVAIAAGCLLAAVLERDRRSRLRSGWPAISEDTIHLLRRLYPVLVGLTLAGYTVWIGVGLARGLNLEDVRTVIATQDNFLLPIKDKLATVPGLTTLTQAAVPAAIVGVLIDMRHPSVAVRRAYRIVILLALVRAFLMAERLAVAEIVVPIVVLRATALGHRLIGWRRLLLSLAPLVGLVFLLAGFAASEYSRSWNWYSSRTDVGFVSFASERLLGYYSTAHNNGALLLHHGEDVSGIPYHSTMFFWQIPPGSELGGDIDDDMGDDQRRVLKGYGNPEFNSPGGVAAMLVDFGTVGGLLFAFLLGITIGSLHLSFLHGRISGLMFYPMIYTGLLELPRYLYWFQGRATPAVVVAVVVTVLLRHSRPTRIIRHPVPLPVSTAGVGR